MLLFYFPSSFCVDGKNESVKTHFEDCIRVCLYDGDDIDCMTLKQKFLIGFRKNFPKTSSWIVQQERELLLQQLRSISAIYSINDYFVIVFFNFHVRFVNDKNKEERIPRNSIKSCEKYNAALRIFSEIMFSKHLKAERLTKREALFERDLWPFFHSHNWWNFGKCKRFDSHLMSLHIIWRFILSFSLSLSSSSPILPAAASTQISDFPCSIHVAGNDFRTRFTCLLQNRKRK